MLRARAENAPACCRGDGSAQHRLAGRGPLGSQFELLPEPFDLQDQIVDRVIEASEHALNVSATSGSEQQMLGLDRGVPHHARLVVGEQDQVVCLVGEPAQRVLRPGDRGAGISAGAAAVTA